MLLQKHKDRCKLFEKNVENTPCIHSMIVGIIIM